MTCALGHARCKPADRLRPNDVVMFLGNPHLIARIDPYSGIFDGTNDMPKCIGVAKAADGWGMSMFVGDCVEISA